MCPVLILGGVEVRAYALVTWMGAAVACVLAFPALKRAGLTAWQSLAALFLMCAGFLAGARLWNVAVNPDNFLGALKWYTPKLAGLSFYGGVLGAAAALAAAAKRCKAGMLPLLDAMTVPAGVAFCVARIGCFLNGCCGGVATNGPFGVVFPDNALPGHLLPGVLSFLQNRPVHPTQLYELAGAAVGLAAVILYCRRTRAKPGVRFLLYAAVFSAVRLAVLPLRALAYSPVVKEVFYPVLYIAVILACAAGIRAINRRTIY